MINFIVIHHVSKRVFHLSSLTLDLSIINVRSPSWRCPQCVDDLVFWIIYNYRARNERVLNIDNVRGEREERILIHRSLARCTNRNVRSLSGVYVTGDWLESMDAFYFMSKGLRKDIEKRGFLGTQMRSCNSLDRVTIALLPTNRRLGNKKSVRFPRIFALLPWRDHKIRHRRHASLPFQLYVAIAACQTPGTGHKSGWIWRAYPSRYISRNVKLPAADKFFLLNIFKG